MLRNFSRMSAKIVSKERVSNIYTGPLINTDEFAEMKNEMNTYDSKREIVIKKSRDILKLSKHSIFALHRGALDTVEENLSGADKVINELSELIESEPSLRNGSYAAAMEEYAEAHCFKHFLSSGRLVSKNELKFVNRDEYLGGVVDCTGEIARYAIQQATIRNVEEVEKCRDIVDAVSGELIQFDFRNSPLRKKYDSLKYNLRKLENTLYELSLISNGFRTSSNGDDIDEGNKSTDNN